jgi:hypothetical protein
LFGVHAGKIVENLGRRLMITTDSLEEWIQNLPAAVIKQSPRRRKT